MYPKVVEKYEQHYSLELCFSIEKQTETVLSGGVFRIGARRSGQVGPLLNGCNDFDETLMEYGPGRESTLWDGWLPPENLVEKKYGEKTFSPC